ncbi:hypothetical protein Tco_0375256 [Tanacetum coccineum]
MSSPSKHKETRKGKNVTTSNILSNSSRGATPNEASTLKGGDTVKTTNSFVLLNSSEVDPTTHEEPSDPKVSMQRVGVGKSSCRLTRIVRWKETIDDDDDDEYDPYDDDVYNTHGLSEEQKAICDALDINIHG